MELLLEFQKRNKMRKYFFLRLSLLFLFSCEEEFVPKDINIPPQLVVESYIELSNNALPVYALLTKSLSFYDSFSIDQIQSNFVHGADVQIKVNSDSFKLNELCLSQLTPELKELVYKQLGLDADSVKVDFCIYVDLLNQIPKWPNVPYKLDVKYNNEIYTASTSIPDFVPLDSIWFEDTPGKPLDSFAQMFCKIADPPTPNYYRYFTSKNSSQLIANVSSVTNDVFFNGKEFKFTLARSVDPGETFSDTLGLWRVGDTISVKWCLIDESHYNFWNTLEVSRQRQGPFSSYVRIDGNIENALGIFGGQRCETYTRIVKK